MEHFDRFLVDGKTRAGGENHGADRRQADQQQHQESQNFHHAEKMDQLLKPNPMVIDGGAGYRFLQPFQQGRRVQLSAGFQLDVDELGQGKTATAADGTQPGFQQGHDSALTDDLGASNSGRRSQDIKRRLDAPGFLPRGGGAFGRNDLNRQRAADAGTPALHHGSQNQHPGQGQTSQVNHEGNQPGQESAECVAIERKIGAVGQHGFHRGRSAAAPMAGLATPPAPEAAAMAALLGGGPPISSCPPSRRRQE